MSDTEVDEPPAGQATDWGRLALIFVPLLVGLLLVATLGARMLTAEIPDRTVERGPVEEICWDGESRPAEQCGVPSGRVGLRWMFPSFKPADLRCRDALPDFPKSTRPTMLECKAFSPVGPSTITYSELTEVERARANLEKRFGLPPEEIDDELGPRLMWTEGDKPRNGFYELAVMYVDLPFAVEVRAGSAEARDRAFDLVRFRAVDDASVRPGEGVLS
jgi:hypothetical protein